MKSKIILVATLLTISATTAWFWPTMPALSTQPPESRAKNIAELELENQLRLAKVDLHKAASSYLLSINKLRRKIFSIEAHWNVYTSELCQAKRAMGASSMNKYCQKPHQLDGISFITDTKKSANHLKIAEQEFKSRTNSIRHDACNKLRYLCSVKESATLQSIMANMPPTDLDSDINKAIEMLPNTVRIMEAIFQKHFDKFSPPKKS